MEFKEKSKFVRQKLFMSQKDFAKALGVSFATVNRWENGLNEPNYKAQKENKRRKENMSLFGVRRYE